MTTDKQIIERYAIIKDEHACFGYFKEFDAECEMCEVYHDCEGKSDTS